MEQQAQIIQDYYRVLKGSDPESRSSDWTKKYNVGVKKALTDYQPYVGQLQSAGPFEGSARGPMARRLASASCAAPGDATRRDGGCLSATLASIPCCSF